MLVTHFQRLRSFSNYEEPSKLRGRFLAGFRYSYHFPAYGIYIFFDSAKLVQTLRFDSPFVGKIEGISIGDSKEKILRLKGEPVKRFDGFPDTDSWNPEKSARLKSSRIYLTHHPRSLYAKPLRKL